MEPIMSKDTKQTNQPKEKHKPEEKVKIPFSRRLLLFKDKLSESSMFLLIAVLLMILISYILVFIILFFVGSPYNPELQEILNRFD